jgi:hypothetical protein
MEGFVSRGDCKEAAAQRLLIKHLYWNKNIIDKND